MSNSNNHIKVVGRNAGYNVIGYLVSIFTLFLITPYSLQILGNERFGLWALISVVTSFATLTNLGFDQAVVKFVAEEFEKKNNHIIKEIISSATIVYLVSIGIGCAIIFFSSHFIAENIFNISSELIEEFSFVLNGITFVFFIRTVFSVFRSLLLGLQRFDLDNINLIVSRIISAAGVFTFLGLGFGLKGLVYNNFLVSFISIVINLIFIFRIFNSIPFSFRSFSIIEIRKIWKYSVHVFSASIINMLSDPIIKTTISNLNNLNYVTYYDIGSRIPGIIKNTFISAMDALLPAVVVMNTNPSKGSNANFYLIVFRTIWIFTFPFFLIGVVLAKPFIYLWIGSEYNEVVQTIYFLIVANFLGLLATLPVKLFLGIGKPVFMLFDAVFSILVMIILIFPLSFYFGYSGFLISIIFSYLFSSAFLNYYSIKTLKISFFQLLKNFPIKPVLIIIMLSLLLFVFDSLFNYWNWFILFLVGFCFTLTYFILLIGLNILNNFEKEILTSVKRKVYSAISKPFIIKSES